MLYTSVAGTGSPSNNRHSSLRAKKIQFRPGFPSVLLIRPQVEAVYDAIHSLEDRGPDEASISTLLLGQGAGRCMKHFELNWLPLPIQQQLGPPPGLKDYQQAWFWNLFWKSLLQEWPGYLPESVYLWRLAEAHCQNCFEKDCSAVMAVWERAEIAGRGVLYYPPLVAIIQEQLKKIKGKRPRIAGSAVVVFSEESTTIHSECGDFSPSLFDLDVGLKKEERKQSYATGVVTGKRAQRVQETRNVLCESLRRYGGNHA